MLVQLKIKAESNTYPTEKQTETNDYPTKIIQSHTYRHKRVQFLDGLTRGVMIQMTALI